MLRHDWRFPNTQAALGPVLAGFFNGWLPAGIGSPQPYPTFYYFGLLLWPLHSLLSPLAVVAAIVTAAILIVTFSAGAIARRHGGGAIAAAGLAAFAALNPWVYAKLVAGHVFMVLAYALLAALVAELAREKPRTPVLILLAALSVTQIEFCVLLILPLSVWFVYTRRYAALAALWISVLPIAVGILGSLSSISSTPYNLEWQRAESVPLFSGLTLLGYQFKYAASFEPWRWPLAACALIAALGLRFLKADALGIITAIAGAFCLVLASGTQGPIAPLYAYAVTHVAASGVFRELYDLLAVLAIAYVLLASRQLGVSRASSAIFFLAAASLAVPWLAHPAFTWFVSGKTLPAAMRPSDSLTRVAYFPAFQPLSFHGQGAGVDPDAYAIPQTANPINEATPAYPVDTALSFAMQGDFNPLAALSVSSIVSRTGYSSNWRALRYQFSFASRTKSAEPATKNLAALPLAVLYSGTPNATSIGNGLRENSFAPVMTRAFIFRPDRATLDAARAWVDARTAFIARPEWGNPWGGVVTSSTAPLALPSGTAAILAQTSGVIVDESGRRVAIARPALHWWKTAGRALTCNGACLVVAAAPEVPAMPEHAAPQRFAAVRAAAATWWSAVDVPANAHETTLRYNVRYDSHWTAFSNGHVLEHVPLDGIFNGWIVPAGTAPQHIILVETLAAGQFVLELCASLAILVLLASASARSNAFQLFRNEHGVDLHDAGTGS